MTEKEKNEKGIVIAVPEKYENICLTNVQNLRKLNCNLPIEIWEIGEELSAKAKIEFAKIENLTFKNVNNYCDNGQHWKGFQIKAFILFYTSFEEVILCDSDVIIHQNPESILMDENYLRTGTYFFKDLEKWKFSKLNNSLTQFRQKFFYKKFTNAAFYLKRKNWLTALLPKKSIYFPTEWDYLYSNNLPNKPVKEALQESGVVYMNKKTHQESVQYIYDLNNNYEETYKYIWGDKETFWIGCVMANKAFYFNPVSGYVSNKTKHLTHDYNGKVFFSQKGV